MEPLWWVTKDGDRSCLALYERHYSAYHYKDGRVRSLFMGPGEKIVLRTQEADALFGWRKFIDGSRQQGINCSVFRNEGTHRSSDLIRQADAIADVSSGLIAGITPMSQRRRLGQGTLDFASSKLVGNDAASPKAD